MRLFLLPSDFRGSDTLILTGKDYNYIVNVLRLHKGSKITGRDAEGGTWNLTITEITGKSCILAVVPSSEAKVTTDALPENRPEKNIILYQCIPKGRKLDVIIRMSTEIGVRSIVPVKSRNCVADFSGKENSRLDRYTAIIKEAVQQSGSLVPTTVESVLDIAGVPQHFADMCKKLKTEGKGVFLHQCSVGEQQYNLFSALGDFHGTVGVLIGSEGGLTDEECKNLTLGGFCPVLLKSNILRCETAAIYAVSAIQTIIEQLAEHSS